MSRLGDETYLARCVAVALEFADRNSRTPSLIVEEIEKISKVVADSPLQEEALQLIQHTLINTLEVEEEN